ncbi:hypothetical protein [Micromonospora sp. RTP1Z1]|uniref:hypothetical protein n=1 Tax=Micromonospora sp. RTP1Z1 TaxID=2994043 RepID=UPI0029C9802C|nr:hypothetical protein [Micromonospora sp. RTP1Z1]
MAPAATRPSTTPSARVIWLLEKTGAARAVRWPKPERITAKLVGPERLTAGSVEPER